MSFECPICSGPTEVSETRHNASGLRRARRCVSAVCHGRLTTQELPVLVTRGGPAVRQVAIPQQLIDRLADLASDLLKASERHRVSYGEETDGAW